MLIDLRYEVSYISYQGATHHRLKLMFTPEHKKLIKSRIRDYKKYDVKRWGAEAQELTPTITYEEYLELYIEQQGACYWSGKQMVVGVGIQTVEASLDRLHCSKPHTKDNCILCHRALNLGRNDSTILEWCEYLEMMGILSPALQIELDSYRASL